MRSRESALEAVDGAMRGEASERVLLPVIAYYGAGRAWLPHRDRNQTKAKSNGPARRWGHFTIAMNVFGSTDWKLVPRRGDRQGESGRQ